jgi:FkbM family methyltransferase
MHAYPRWTILLLPYSRLELPAWGRVLSVARVTGWRYDHSLWSAAPAVVTRGKVHGLLMRLELSNWAERMSFFLGRYYELHLQLLLPKLIRPGDHVLDVGANIGMLTLCLSALVGEHGMVESFEPNPDCVARLGDQLALNAIRNVVVRPVALGDADATMKLRLQTNRRTPSLHSGIGTLTPVAESAEDVVVKEYEVQVCRGDDIVGAKARPVSLIKLDVEGFEFNALNGLRGTLENSRPAVVMEFMEEHLSRAGVNRAQIRSWMDGLGYEGFALRTRRRRLRHRLEIRPLGDAAARGAEYNDVLWLHTADDRRALLDLEGARDG